MGVVYKGRHAMLRRPTAIKLLDADKVTDQSIGRFEREVQITSQLTHPNTVAIFDFGRTPEGVFYYAMEYLEGIDLQALVDQYGPQPAGRVIHILRQVCGSLYEAHSTGLVHRDIKPANLMLTRRGGEADVVKVLDFGLVKAREDDPQGGEAQGLAGTPLYMSPEAIQLPNSVDGCSDIYAVGAVGYFLLTGRPVFEAASIMELCNKHVSETPVPPSQRLGKPVPEDLENAILACLEKTRAKRPQTARDLAAASLLPRRDRMDARRRRSLVGLPRPRPCPIEDANALGVNATANTKRRSTTELVAAPSALAPPGGSTPRTVANRDKNRRGEWAPKNPPARGRG
jgi:serine/threonine protein kinase